MVTNRTVAFFDILGFRKLVEERPLSELGPQFLKTMDGVRTYLNRPVLPDQNLPRLLNPPTQQFCLTFAFSDSLILISHDSSASSCLALLVYAVVAMRALMASGFPVRAGISFGEMFVDVSRSIFLGRALTAAFDSERDQQWAGGLIDDSVAEALPELLVADSQNMLNILFPCYPVPFKTGTTRNQRTLNWRWNLVVKYGTRSLFRPTLDTESTKKVTNTLAYAKWIRSSGLAYPADPGSVPVEVRALFAGDGPPPPMFSHGDEW